MNLRLLWLASLASLLLGLYGGSALLKSGCSADPNGLACGPKSGASADVGCTIDPSGCKPRQVGSASADGGSSMDANGDS